MRLPITNSISVQVQSTATLRETVPCDIKGTVIPARSSNEPHRPPRNLRYVADHRARDHLVRDGRTLTRLDLFLDWN
jgi:hypothetical protein